LDLPQLLVGVYEGVGNAKNDDNAHVETD